MARKLLKGIEQAAQYAKKRASKRDDAPQKVHDRRATPEARHGLTRVVHVDNPYDAREKIESTQSLRGDPLGLMHSRNQIGQHEYDAGRKMQRLYHRIEIGGLKAMDTTKEPVDGGGIYQDIVTDSQMDAAKEISRLERALGMEGAALIRQFLACEMFIEQIASQRGLTSQREKDYLGKRIRECLETLAVETGTANRKAAS